MNKKLNNMKTKTLKPTFRIVVVLLLCLLAKLSDAQVPNNAYEDNMVQVDIINGQPVFAIYSGDINQDGNVDLSDFDALDFGINNFEFGYLPADLNGDGNVDLSDYPYWDVNNFNFVYVHRPF